MRCECTPRGFKILSHGSPLERAMKSYFHLPPKPPQRLIEEKTRLQAELHKMYPSTKRKLPPVHEGDTSGGASVGGPRKLDGFLLLDACAVKDPEEALEAIINDAELTGVVSEDLSFFTRLKLLDVGENMLSMGDLAPLLNLEELHLHCNLISKLNLVAGSFLRLTTLNLSFNQLSAGELEGLGVLTSLERLDLSCNNLRRLPLSMRFLSSVRQLALENNKFEGGSVLLSLADMPQLAEVNLNYNMLTSVPRIPEGGFPSLEVLGLASNRILYFEDVYALSQLPGLQRIVLWGNPIQHRRKDSEILLYEFGIVNVQVIFESPVPPKRGVGAFYAANTASLVKVKDLTGDKSGKKKKKAAGDAEPPMQSAPTTSGAGEGPSFFVTQPTGGAATGANAQAAKSTEDGTPASGPPAPPGPTSSQPVGASPSGGADSSWFSNTHPTPQLEVTQGRRSAQKAPRASSAEEEARRQEALYVCTQQVASEPNPYPSPSAYQDDDAGICRSSTNMRTALSELKRLLRQPLPPVHQSQLHLARPGGRHDSNTV